MLHADAADMSWAATSWCNSIDGCVGVHASYCKLALVYSEELWCGIVLSIS
jgi:hypothetical protein